MKTVKYTSYKFINKATGGIISCRKEHDELLQLYTGVDSVVIDGKNVSIFSDKIETVGEGKKAYRTRVTTVEVEDVHSTK